MGIDTGPCHNCEKREVGCHSNCEEYTNWRSKQLEEKEKIHKYRMSDWELTDFRQKRIEAMKRNHGYPHNRCR